MKNTKMIYRNNRSNKIINKTALNDLKKELERVSPGFYGRCEQFPKAGRGIKHV